MFRLFIRFDKNEGNFGLGSSKEYFFQNSDQVCDVIKSLSGLKCVYSLAEFSFSSVADIKRDFKLIPDNEKEKENKDELL